eukprot:PRCOL_00001101-RA
MIARARPASGAPGRARAHRPRQRRRRAEAGVSRRSALKGAFAALECTLFPAATELLTRPGLPGEPKATPSDLLRPEAWKSLAPYDMDGAAQAEAAAALARGDELVASGDPAGAVGEYERAADLVGSGQYKLWQAATLRGGHAKELAGDRAAGNANSSEVWWWGRGLRWPGWYIIAYLSARSAYYDTKYPDGVPAPARATSRASARGALGAKARGAEPKRKAGNDLIFELIILTVGGIGLLAALLEYGLPDYV